MDKLVERLGLKYVGPEKFYRTIYVQPMLTFEVKIADELSHVQVPVSCCMCLSAVCFVRREGYVLAGTRCCAGFLAILCRSLNVFHAVMVWFMCHARGRALVNLIQDWLDWDPNSFFYQHVATPSRMALGRPLSARVNADGSPMLGGMKHLIKGLYKEGAPHKISFSYIPKWKSAEIESKVLELKLRLSSSVPPAKTADEIRAEIEELERRAHACRRPVSVSDMSEVALAQGTGVLRGNRLIVDEAITESGLMEWESLEGCYMYYTPTSAKSHVWKTRKLVLDFVSEDKCCVLEEPKRKGGKQMVGADVTVRYKLVSEIVFKISKKDDDRIALVRQAAVPKISQALDLVYPFVGDEFVVSRSCASSLQVRRAALLSAIRSESQDAESVATTLPAAQPGDDELLGKAAAAAPSSLSSGLEETDRKWRLLDACDVGVYVLERERARARGDAVNFLARMICMLSRQTFVCTRFARKTLTRSGPRTCVTTTQPLVSGRAIRSDA